MRVMPIMEIMSQDQSTEPFQRACDPSAFSPATLADALAAGLAEIERRLAEEQAVHGIDTLDELRLHPRLHEALHEAGYGVHPEQRYPCERGKQRRSEGLRCDIVLTPDRRPLCVPEASPTLFADSTAVDLDDACWIEVKVVPQHLGEGPNARYATELLGPVRADVVKLATDGLIRHAIVLLVLFTEGPEVAEHDTAAWHTRALDRGLLVGTPATRHVPIADRVGNRFCSVALFPLMRL